MTTAAVVLLFLSLSISLVAGDWNILNYITKKDNNKKLALRSSGSNDDNGVDFTVKNYCAAWRFNVELNNIRGFDVVPGECIEYIGKYMTSVQYKVDIHTLVEEVTLYLTNNFYLSGDGKDAWVFDIDEVLLSNVPFYSQHQFGGIRINISKYEAWMGKAEAPALDHMVYLFHQIRVRGLKVFIISSRPEYLRKATVENLVNVGYHGWTELILRGPEDHYDTAEKFKAEKRGKLVQEGYRLWGIVGSQWSSIGGYSTARRIFKLPNPMYYVP